MQHDITNWTHQKSTPSRAADKIERSDADTASPETDRPISKASCALDPRTFCLSSASSRGHSNSETRPLTQALPLGCRSIGSAAIETSKTFLELLSLSVSYWGAYPSHQLPGCQGKNITGYGCPLGTGLFFRRFVCDDRGAKYRGLDVM